LTEHGYKQYQSCAKKFYGIHIEGFKKKPGMRPGSYLLKKNYCPTLKIDSSIGALITILVMVIGAGIWLFSMVNGTTMPSGSF